MKNLKKLTFTTLAVGTYLALPFSANAATLKATYTLVAPPAKVELSEAGPMAFETITIPREGEDNVVKNVQHTAIIRNGVGGTAYTVTVKAPTCTTGVSLVLGPSYADVPLNNGTFTYRNNSTEMKFTGKLTVTSVAQKGAGVCSYDVTVAAS